MIDLTPIDVRKKKGDFRRGIRGYETPQVDDFLELTADRLEAVVRENAEMSERLKRLDQQLAEFKHREKALTDALVSAQTMREEIRSRSTREGDEVRRKAEEDAARIRSEAEEVRRREESLLEGIRARQLNFLSGYRAFLERELGDLQSQAIAIEERLGLTIPPAPSSPQAPWSAPVDDSAEVTTEAVWTPAVDDAATETLELDDLGWEPEEDVEASSPAPTPDSSSLEWAPTEETFKPSTLPQASAPAESAAPVEPVDDLDEQLGTLLAEWTPSDEIGEGDEVVDFFLSDADVEDATADETDLFLSDADVIAPDAAATEEGRLFEDDEEAAFVAATGFNSSPVPDDEPEDAFVLSENDMVLEAESVDDLLGDVDIDALLEEVDPFGDEAPAFAIGPAPSRAPVDATHVAHQAADDAAFLDDLNDELLEDSPAATDSAVVPDFDPFEDDGGFLIGPASRNGHKSHDLHEPNSSMPMGRNEEFGAEAPVEEIEAEALGNDIEIEALAEKVFAETSDHDDVEARSEDAHGVEAVVAQESAETEASRRDLAAAFGEEPDTLDHLLDTAGLAKVHARPPQPELPSSFAVSFGLTLRETFNGNGEQIEDEADRAPRSLGESRDFYSVPRALE
jgi:cell division initiation protein